RGGEGRGGPGVRKDTGAVCRVETSTANGRVSVQATGRVLGRRELNDSAEFASILSRIPRGENAHRFNVIRFEIGRKSGRPVLVQWNAVHNKLDGVLRTPRMEHAVGFV